METVSTMNRTMPRFIQKELHTAVDYMQEGPNTEAAVLDKASELGYEIESENDGNRNEEGGYIHSVHVVSDDGHDAWIHFNHPGKDYAKHNAEWFWYIL